MGNVVIRGHNKFICFVKGFFADENSEMRKAFLSTAGALRDSFKFMHTKTAELLEKFGYNE